MKAFSLFVVLALAKVAALWGRNLAPSVWAPLAYFWQDALIALLFGVFELAVKRERVKWAVYGALVLYAAANVPLIRVLSTPMTWSMTRAARGTLADSIKHHLTGENILIIVTLLAVAFFLPLAGKHISLMCFGFGFPLTWRTSIPMGCIAAPWLL